MRFKKYLKEKYYKGFKFSHPMIGKDVYIEIFENPSSKELREIQEYNEVWFIAVHKNKKVYAWTPRLIHDEAIKYIKNVSYKDDIVAGSAERKGAGFVMMNLSDLETSITWTSNPEHWKWADKYINLTNYLKGVYSAEIASSKP